MEKMEIVNVSKSLIVYDAPYSFDIEVEILVIGNNLDGNGSVCRLSIVNEE